MITCDWVQSQSYLYEGSVALALLPVDVQTQLLAHLADLRPALNEVNPGRLALLPLVCISRQVVQQLWEKARRLLALTMRETTATMQGLVFLVTAIRGWEK